MANGEWHRPPAARWPFAAIAKGGYRPTTKRARSVGSAFNGRRRRSNLYATFNALARPAGQSICGCCTKRAPHKPVTGYMEHNAHGKFDGAPQQTSSAFIFLNFS